MEFPSENFKRFCAENGIIRHKTVPANSRQNGLIERINMTLLERERCMLSSSGLGKELWGEAVNTACHLMNKSPAIALNLDTPEHIWSGRTPSYSYLKSFGCLAYVHVKQHKLELRALKCVMLGYQQGVKGYRLWCIEKSSEGIVISRDVIFNGERISFLETSFSENKLTNS